MATKEKRQITLGQRDKQSAGFVSENFGLYLRNNRKVLNILTERGLYIKKMTG